MPQRRNSSMVRAFSAVARGCPMLPSPCSTTVHSTPRQPRSPASPSPTGPAPTISTGVCVTLFDAAAIDYSHARAGCAYCAPTDFRVRNSMKTRGVTKREVAASLGALALLAAMPLGAGAQVTGRPITIIVPYSPGTGIDILARSIATDLSSHFGQPVVVDNRTGASGNIGTGMAARAAPDGNTLLMIAKTYVVNPSLFKSVPYDPVTSFEPIIKLATGTIVLAVHPSVPANDVREFVAYVKSQPPGSVNYGSAGFATPHHLSMELFKHAAGVNLTHIPYKGTSGVMTDLIGNHVSAMFIPTHVALPFMRDQQIRVLGVAGRERSAAMPDI